MNQHSTFEQAFADYIKPFLNKGQTIELEYRQRDTVYDLVVKESNFVTHIFEVKKSDSLKSEIIKQMSRIKEAYLYSAEGDKIEVGVYLALFNNGQWKVFDHRDLNKPLDIKKVLKQNSLSDQKSMRLLKTISIVLGLIYMIIFGIHLWFTLPFSGCNTELSPSLVTLGVFSAVLLILPFILSYIKKLTIWGLEIELKEDNKERLQ